MWEIKEEGETEREEKKRKREKGKKSVGKREEERNIGRE